MRQSACLVNNSIVDGNFATLYNCSPGLGVRLFDGPYFKLFILVGLDRCSCACCLVYRGSTDDLLLQIFNGVV